MHVAWRVVGSAVVAAWLVAAQARAQFVPAAPEAESARVHAGPLLLNPTLSLNNVGLDTNLFNQADVAEPRRDLALTFVPQTEIWMRAGRTWLTGNLREDLVWFRDYRDQRSANGTFKGGWLVPLNRLSMHVEGQYVRSRERPSYEIDIRADRRERAGTLTLEARPLPRTFIGTRLEQREIRFSDTVLFGGERLAAQLNRTRTAGLLAVRHELTPMTSLTVEGSAFRDRFVIARERDSQSAQIAAGVRFDPSALVNGFVLVGYRHFSPGTLEVPDYRGPTLSASVSYVARSSTRLTIDAGRDVEYSYDPGRPYYLLSGAAATLTQHIAGPFDVQGRVGLRALAYRDRLDAAVVTPDRNDRVWSYGGAIGYRLGAGTRLSVEIETQQRISPVLLRNYRGTRYGMGITWVP